MASKRELSGVTPGDRLTPETALEPRPRRAGTRFWGFVRRTIALFILLGLLGGLAAGAFAWHTYQRYAAELPSLDGLRTYQPKVMSRVYAGDDRPPRRVRPPSAASSCRSAPSRTW